MYSSALSFLTDLKHAALCNIHTRFETSFTAIFILLICSLSMQQILNKHVKKTFDQKFADVERAVGKQYALHRKS